MREIGSEFWIRQPLVPLQTFDNEAFLLSGRTALKFIIDDICKNRKLRKVLLPEYCCESMIQPFVASGIGVQFYQVSLECIEYPYGNDADAVLLIDFFGYVNPQNGDIAHREKQVGKIIIYDSTHKIDGNCAVQDYADYSFCSYRKWFYCNFAKAIKRGGAFHCSELRHNDRYVALRNKAAEEKEKYFAGLTTNKEVFLSMFASAEQLLNEDYVGYAGEPVAFNIQEIISKRRENAAYLINELKSFSGVKLWRDIVSINDVPMFVPILVDSQIRNDLKSALVKENIYCPVHWPQSIYCGKNSDIYDLEFSLVCDQRYDVKDMERIVGVIKKYFCN